MNLLNSLERAGTVLLVEPHTPSRLVLRNALAQQGYRVIHAVGGKEAEAATQRLEAPLHLLITELVLPDMDGLQLAERLSARTPSLRVLLVSGDCHDVVFLDPGMANRAVFVRKPVEPRAVVTRAAALLQAA